MLMGPGDARNSGEPRHTESIHIHSAPFPRLRAAALLPCRGEYRIIGELGVLAALGGQQPPASNTSQHDHSADANQGALQESSPGNAVRSLIPFTHTSKSHSAGVLLHSKPL